MERFPTTRVTRWLHFARPVNRHRRVGSVIRLPCLAVVLIGLLCLPFVVAPPLQGQDIRVELRASAGTEIRIAEFGPFLQSNLTIGELEKNLEVRLVLLAQEGGELSSWTSGTVELVPGRAYPTRRWITDADALTSQLVAPLKPAEFVIFRIGQKTLAEPGLRVVPRECRGTSHAVLATLVELRGRMSGPSGTGKTMVVCLDAGH